MIATAASLSGFFGIGTALALSQLQGSPGEAVAAVPLPAVAAAAASTSAPVPPVASPVQLQVVIRRIPASTAAAQMASNGGADGSAAVGPASEELVVAPSALAQTAEPDQVPTARPGGSDPSAGWEQPAEPNDVAPDVAQVVSAVPEPGESSAAAGGAGSGVTTATAPEAPTVPAPSPAAGPATTVVSHAS